MRRRIRTWTRTALAHRWQWPSWPARRSAGRGRRTRHGRSRRLSCQPRWWGPMWSGMKINTLSIIYMYIGYNRLYWTLGRRHKILFFFVFQSNHLRKIKKCKLVFVIIITDTIAIMSAQRRSKLAIGWCHKVRYKDRSCAICIYRIPAGFTRKVVFILFIVAKTDIDCHFISAKC